MEKIHKFIECLLPVTSCNLRCSYCYVIQENRRKMEIPKLDYRMDTMLKAMTKERFGGTCYFSICGAGETLAPDYTLELVNGLLKNGHYVNITTNGTLTKRFEELTVNFPAEYLTRLHIAFSFHYLELKRLNILDKFFENIRKVKEAGCSFVVQVNLCDEYMPYIDEIMQLCKKHTGAYPQAAVTRKEESYPDVKVTLGTEGTESAYVEAGRKFGSPLFEFTCRNFLVKRREFCYAGDWAYVLNLKTGLLKRCYCSCVVQNIFKDINKPVFKMAVGKHCNSRYCSNSSHFMALGVIPEIAAPSYYMLRNRGGKWYQERMRFFLDGKLSETNRPYPAWKKAVSGLVGIYDRAAYSMYLQLLKLKTQRETKFHKESDR